MMLLFGAGCGDDPVTTEKPGPGPEPDPDPIVKYPTLTIEAGTCTNNSGEILLSAEDAEEMAYIALAPEDAEHVFDAAGIFQVGTTVPSSTEPKAFTVSNLRAGTEYTVWAAARAEDRYSEPKSVVLHTSEQPPILSFVSSTKTGFGYRVENITETQVFIHTYLEKWAYDELYAIYKDAAGPDFDLSVMLCNTLVDYGFEAVGPQTIEWHAGDENLPREGPATIVGGKTYYAIASLVDPASGQWIGDPEQITFTTEPAGASNAMIDIVIEELTTEQLRSRIEPDPSIRFYFYHLFPKADVDTFVAELGQEAFENYIYENGYCSDGAYTDLWRFSVPGDTYVLSVLGVDKNGDTMYTDRLIEAPAYVPEIVIALQPYESELQGYMTYNSLEATVAPENFGDTPLDNMMWSLVPAEAMDAILDAGMSVEEAVSQGFLMPYPIAAEWYEALVRDGYFIATFDGLEPSTEYCFVVLTTDPTEELMVRYARATTEAEPAQSQPDAEYLAALGTWKLSGQSTENWSSPLEYTFTVEQLTPNRSFLVKGWSQSDIGIDYPFVMNYDPQTKKLFVRAPQRLGTFNEDGTDYEVCFSGLFMYGTTDDLTPLYGSSHIAYKGSVSGGQMHLFGEIFKYEDRDYSFLSLGYTGRSAEGDFHRFAGDLYDPIYFRISATDAMPSNRNAASVAGRRSVLRWLKPAQEVRIPLRYATEIPTSSPATEHRIRSKALGRESTASERIAGPLRPLAHATR